MMNSCLTDRAEVGPVEEDKERQEACWRSWCAGSWCAGSWCARSWCAGSWCAKGHHEALIAISVHDCVDGFGGIACGV